MKKRKIIALTLLVAFLCSLCIPCTWAIAEDGDNTNTPPATENEGMEISKTAKANGCKPKTPCHSWNSHG